MGFAAAIDAEYRNADAVIGSDVSAIANADGAMAATAALPAADLIKDLLELLDVCCISKFKTKTN